MSNWHWFGLGIACAASGVLYFVLGNSVGCDSLHGFGAGALKLLGLAGLGGAVAGGIGFVKAAARRRGGAFAAGTHGVAIALCVLAIPYLGLGLLALSFASHSCPTLF